jgi:hypothetical protein
MVSIRTLILGRPSPAQIGRRVMAPACGLALAVLLAGNVAAVEIEREGSSGPDVIKAGLDHRLLLEFKLHTTAGYYMLVYG